MNTFVSLLVSLQIFIVAFVPCKHFRLSLHVIAVQTTQYVYLIQQNLKCIRKDKKGDKKFNHFFLTEDSNRNASYFILMSVVFITFFTCERINLD